MKAEMLEHADQIKADLTEIAEKAHDITTRVKDRWNDTYRDVERGVRKAKVAAEQSVEDAREKIKARPITTVATVAIGAFATGLLAGWIVGKVRR